MVMTLSPADRTVILFGKALGSLAVMVALEAVPVLLATVLFNVNLLNPGGSSSGSGHGWICPGWHAPGCDGGQHACSRGHVAHTALALRWYRCCRGSGHKWPARGLRWADLRGWTQLLVVYDLLIAAASLLTFETVVEA